MSTRSLVALVAVLAGCGSQSAGPAPQAVSPTEQDRVGGGERRATTASAQGEPEAQPATEPSSLDLAVARLSALTGDALTAEDVIDLHPASCADAVEGVYVHLGGEDTVIARVLVHLGEGRWIPWTPRELRGPVDGASLDVECVDCDGAGLPELVVRQRDFRAPIARWNAAPWPTVEHTEIVRIGDGELQALATWTTAAQPIIEAEGFAHRARIEPGRQATLRVRRETSPGARARDGRALVAAGEYRCEASTVVRVAAE
jgi:hypothetical protein